MTNMTIINNAHFNTPKMYFEHSLGLLAGWKV